MTTPTGKKGKVAICQITSTDDVQHNLDISIDVCRRAAAAGAEAIFLPEAADFIVPTALQCYNLSQPLATHTYALGLASLAKELGVWIAAGIHELPSEDDGEDVLRSSREKMKVYNSHVAINPKGEFVACYRKIHLFDVALKDPTSPTLPSGPIKKTGESDRMLSGTTITPPISFGPSVGPVGLEICYDLRFPELHTILVRKGARVLVVPSAFTMRTGRDHWYTLLKALAIQFQVYVLAPAQAGSHNPTRKSWGESLAFTPWGTELGRLQSLDDYEKAGEDGTKAMPSEFFVVEVDMEEVESVREQIPLAIQKRTDVYGTVGEGVD